MNIEELTKTEHDLYMMGVFMACLGNSTENNKQKERKKLRAKYRFMVRIIYIFFIKVRFKKSVKSLTKILFYKKLSDLIQTLTCFRLDMVSDKDVIKFLSN